MIKLNIQRFGHTNSTPNYELPQFVGTDKPQWLTDINQGFLAIDTAIHNAYSLASLTSTNVGDISDLTTTVKTDVVSAVNEINGGLGDLSSTVASHTTAIGNNTTAIGNLADLDTVDKGDLVGAINEVDLIATNNATSIGTLSNLNTTAKNNLVSAINEVDGLVNKLNLTTFNTYNTNVMTITNGTITSGSITVASNSDYSVIKVYGQVLFGSDSVWYNVITINDVIPADYRPSSAITINPCGVAITDVNTPFNTEYLVLNTNGSIEIHVNKQVASSMSIQAILIPFIIFTKDFGDVPTPTP